jgi:hypothetical protein
LSEKFDKNEREAIWGGGEGRALRSRRWGGGAKTEIDCVQGAED